MSNSQIYKSNSCTMQIIQINKLTTIVQNGLPKHNEQKTN